MSGFKAFRFKRDEFNQFLSRIDWLRYCDVRWRGEGELQMVEVAGPPGEERPRQIVFKHGEQIPSITVAMMSFCLFKGGYQNEGLESEPQPGEALARATALLLSEKAKQMKAEQRGAPEA